MAFCQISIAESTSTQDNLIIETHLLPTQAYPQSQLIYRIRVMSTLDIREARLSAPEGKNITLYPEYKQRQFRMQRDGTTFDVIERSYALFPTHPGKTKLEPIDFQGIAQTLVTSGNMRYPKHFKIHRKSESHALAIDPTPKSSAHWLPASRLSLHQHWQGDSQYKLGEPITRTITLQATGLNPAQLPEFQWSHLQGIKVYADKPIVKSFFDGNTVRTIWQQKINYIPTQTGEFILPQLKLTWFNTHTGQFETATLAKKAFSLAPVPSTTNNKANNLDAVTSVTKSVSSNIESPLESPIEKMPSQFGQTSLWRNVNIYLGIALLCIAIILKFIWQSPLVCRQKTKLYMHPKRIQYNLWRTRQIQDNRATLNILQDWQATQIASSRKIDDALYAQICQPLQSACYSSTENSLDEKALWSNIKTVLKSAKPAKKLDATSRLPSLFNI